LFSKSRNEKLSDNFFQLKNKKITNKNTFCRVDVTNREKVIETGAKVLKEVGTVTILLNNAGIMPQHEQLKHTEKEIRMIFEINVLAHFWMFEAFLPKMIEDNNGHIVALSSMAGILGLPNLVPYCGSKFAVRGIQEALSEELRLTSEGRSNVINFFFLPD
jgi:NADP-dependent 3-hydroxy acid dehydrogenase YdfG